MGQKPPVCHSLNWNLITGTTRWQHQRLFLRSQPPATPLLPPIQASDLVNHLTHLHSASLITIGHKSKLSVYKGYPETESPEILIVGDSTIRFVKDPRALNVLAVFLVCTSGGKILLLPMDLVLLVIFDSTVQCSGSAL